MNNSQKQEDQLEKQSTTEITSSQTNDSSKCTQGPYKTTFNTENGSFHSQSITGMSSNQGVSLNKGIFLINQQNNTASVDLQVEIKNFDQKNEQRENRLKAKIKNNLKQYWTVFTNTILVKINRRLNKLWVYVQQALEQKNYLSVPAIKRKYRINDYDFYIQSILTQW